MDKFKTMQDFGGVGVIPLFKAIITTIPNFFPIILFFIWLLGTASSYYSILVYTGKKRFWQCITAMSFSVFLMSLVLAGMNEADFTFLSGYWVAFYILMTIGSYFVLDRYK